MAGCSEFVKPDERASVIDVVGEPGDPVAGSTSPSDIVGAAAPSLDEATANSESINSPLPATSILDNSDGSQDSEVETDVVGGIGTAKPVSLKTKKAVPSQTE